MIVLNEVKGQLTYRKIQKSSRYSQNYYRTCGATRGQVATAAPSVLVFLANFDFTFSIQFKFYYVSTTLAEVVGRGIQNYYVYTTERGGRF